MDGDQFLKRLRPAEAVSGALTSSESRLRILHPVVHPPAGSPAVNPAHALRRGTVRTETIRYDGVWRPIRFFLTAGQMSGHTGAAALLGSPSEAEWLLAERIHDADRFRDALKDKGIRLCIQGRTSRGKLPATSIDHSATIVWMLRRAKRADQSAMPAFVSPCQIVAMSASRRNGDRARCSPIVYFELIVFNSAQMRRASSTSPR